MKNTSVQLRLFHLLITLPSVVALLLWSHGAAAQKLYWTDARGIHRATLNGENLETILPVKLSQPSGIAVDASGRKVYWTDTGTRKIQRANLNGSAIEDVITTGLLFSGDIAVGDIALDTVERKIYWSL
jgi:DNA-binding beta-propeller fold protein YncE